MTKSQLSVQSPIRVKPTPTPIAKRPLPPPAERLRRTVDTVLRDLSPAADLARLDDQLRTALAWTAAAGDTCRVAVAVRQVRDARISLGQADLDHARTALLAARDALHPVPSRRLH